MSTLQIVYVALAACLLVVWLLVALIGPRKMEVGQGATVLRYGATLRILALVLAWSPPFVAIYVIWNYSGRFETIHSMAAAGFLAASVVAGLLLIEVERTSLTVGEDGVARQSPWTGRATLAWSEIESVQYSNANRWIVLTGAGKTIRVSRHLDGFDVFVKSLRTKVAQERLAARRCIDAYP